MRRKPISRQELENPDPGSIVSSGVEYGGDVQSGSGAAVNQPRFAGLSQSDFLQTHSPPTMTEAQAVSVSGIPDTADNRVPASSSAGRTSIERVLRRAWLNKHRH